MKYFSFQEFERSETATKLSVDNRVPGRLKGNIQALVDNVLDPLREAWGGPIDVSSGYRSPELNRHINGASKTSQHMTGQAADILIYVRDANGHKVKDANGHPIVDKTANRRLFQKILDMKLPFDQLIDEHKFSWVHVSYRHDGRNRHEVKRL